jgi:NAD(P)-dependent dehydrogenase (short-subunit alcohol dehydrogenase family)
MPLERKLPLMAGARSGIGRKSAILFASEGVAVVIVDVDDRGGHETLEDWRGRPLRRPLPHRCLERPATVRRWWRSPNGSDG